MGEPALFLPGGVGREVSVLFTRAIASLRFGCTGARMTVSVTL